MRKHILLVLGTVLFATPAFAHSGKAVYEQTCFSCHAKGVMNAPKLGDKEAWAPRIAEGKPTLMNHADYGFKSMPPHGGNDDLSEQDISAAIDYMVEQAGGYPDKK